MFNAASEACQAQPKDLVRTEGVFLDMALHSAHDARVTVWHIMHTSPQHRYGKPSENAVSWAGAKAGSVALRFGSELASPLPESPADTNKVRYAA